MDGTVSVWRRRNCFFELCIIYCSGNDRVYPVSVCPGRGNTEETMEDRGTVYYCSSSVSILDGDQLSHMRRKVRGKYK